MPDCEPTPIRLHRLHPSGHSKDYTEKFTADGYPLVLKWCEEHEQPWEICEVQ